MPSVSESARGAKRNGAALKARTEDVIADFDALRKDIGKLADAANKAVRHQVETGADNFDHWRHDIEDQARERITAASARVYSAGDSVRDQVRERPAAAMGIALGAGLLLGLLVSSRK